MTTYSDNTYTDTDNDTDTLRENKLTRSDCLITLTTSMTEIKSVTITRNYYVVSLRTIKQSPRPLKVELRYRKLTLNE